jgi:hypothetical protein
MTADPVLVLAWLVLAHLVADFVLQTNAIVADKVAAGRRRSWRGLMAHCSLVGVCLVPVAIAFGPPGLVFLMLVTLSHVAIDRWKVTATRHAEAGALGAARHRPDADESATSLGPGWTPVPAALFVIDQVLHLLVTVAAWAVLLAASPPLEPVAATIDRMLGSWDRELIHRAAVVGAVIASLLIVNIRAAAFFVATLVRPREAVEGLAMPDDRGPEPQGRSWRLRVGPLEAVATPEPTPQPGLDSGGASPARIGATIGILERLLVATFMVTGSQAAIGFVIAAKTLARFRQLDNRDFAEYYLLGTLASVAVAVASGLLASAALQTVT